MINKIIIWPELTHNARNILESQLQTADAKLEKLYNSRFAGAEIVKLNKELQFQAHKYARQVYSELISVIENTIGSSVQKSISPKDILYNPLFRNMINLHLSALPKDYAQSFTIQLNNFTEAFFSREQILNEITPREMFRKAFGVEPADPVSVLNGPYSFVFYTSDRDFVRIGKSNQKVSLAIPGIESKAKFANTIIGTAIIFPSAHPLPESIIVHEDTHAIFKWFSPSESIAKPKTQMPMRPSERLQTLIQQNKNKLNIVDDFELELRVVLEIALDAVADEIIAYTNNEESVNPDKLLELLCPQNGMYDNISPYLDNTFRYLYIYQKSLVDITSKIAIAEIQRYISIIRKMIVIALSIRTAKDSQYSLWILACTPIKDWHTLDTRSLDDHNRFKEGDFSLYQY